MKKILLVLGMAFCFLTSFAPASVEGDVAWAVDPLTKTVKEGEGCTILVTVHETYGKIRNLDITVTCFGAAPLEKFTVGEFTYDSGKYVSKIEVPKFSGVGDYRFKIEISGSYNYNNGGGIITFEQSKNSTITVVSVP